MISRRDFLKRLSIALFAFILPIKMVTKQNTDNEQYQYTGVVTSTPSDHICWVQLDENGEIEYLKVKSWLNTLPA